MVFVGAPVGDDEWVAEELRFTFGKLVSRLPALARMRDAGRLQVAAQARTLLLRYCAIPRAGFWGYAWCRHTSCSAWRRPSTTPLRRAWTSVRRCARAAAPDDARCGGGRSSRRGCPCGLAGSIGLTSAEGHAVRPYGTIL